MTEGSFSDLGPAPLPPSDRRTGSISWRGSEGIIVFEALFDYAVPDEIADGGAKVTSGDKMPKAHLVYGGPDWDLLETSTNRPGGKPKRALVGDDGMKLSVGDASVRKMAKSAADVGATVLLSNHTELEPGETAAKLRAAPRP